MLSENLIPNVIKKQTLHKRNLRQKLTYIKIFIIQY